jgi:O-antigen ligase
VIILELPKIRSDAVRRPVAVAIVTCLGLGVAVSMALGLTIALAGALLALCGVAVGLRAWRWSIVGLLVFLPFSGIAIILTYPHTEVAVLAKDFLFVIPAYLGFVLNRWRKGWTFGGAPVLPIAMLAFLVLVDTVPQLSHPLVALIGAKVWLMYIPLMFLGYYLVDSGAQLLGLLRMISLVAVIPAAIGTVEAGLLYTGHTATVYALYGPAAAAVTQQFVDFSYGNGMHILRVPSIFSSAAQYFDFVSSMVVVSFAWWRLSSSSLALGIALLMLVASLTSGIRAAFVLTPLLLLLLAYFGGRQAHTGVVALVFVFAVASTLFVTSQSLAVFSFAADTGSAEFTQGFVSGIPMAAQHAPLGFGTGAATGASSSYGLNGATVTSPYDQSFSESGWVKAITELGIPGLVVLAFLFLWILGRAFQQRRLIDDPGIRAAAGSLIAFLIWVAIYMTKGPVLDLDPINVYFWLFAGLLFRLPTLAVEHARSDAKVAGTGLRRSLTRVGVEPKPSTP